MTIARRPLKDLWQEEKARHPDTVLFVKIGKFYHLFNDDIDHVYGSGLLLDKHIIHFAPRHSIENALEKMWAIPATIMSTFLSRLDEAMPDLIYRCGAISSV